MKRSIAIPAWAEPPGIDVEPDVLAFADAGLVESERQGRETRYRLTPTGAEWDDRLDALRRHLHRRRE
jgi:DNA-binding transcriptional ArsR family regulator